MKIFTIFYILILLVFPEYGMSENIKQKTAIFGGGCFWCIEKLFENRKGVTSAVSGYIGGESTSPTYEEVSSGRTGHAEAVKVTYNPKIVTYEELLEIFFKGHNPTDGGGQFADRGSQYRSSIFYTTKEEKEISENFIKSLDNLAIFENKIKTTIEKAGLFTKAEQNHQNYYKTNPERYKAYSKASGRDAFIEKLNKKNICVSKGAKKSKKVTTPKKDLKKKLTELQFAITQKNGTEPPFSNKYWDNKEDGIYVDIVSGEALFSSKDKYDSGSGWPSFTRPINNQNIVTKEDNSMFSSRTEVRSLKADSHLGHVFDDGPSPTNKRYCINSAAIRFIPKSSLVKEGYQHLLKEFTGQAQ